MKLICSSCQNEMTLENAKLPPRPFKVKCTKCATVILVSDGAESGSTQLSAEAGAGSPKISAEVQEFIVQELGQIRKELLGSLQKLFGGELDWQQSSVSSFDGMSQSR